MMRIDIVRMEPERTRAHGKSILKLRIEFSFQLSMIWLNTDRNVCANSYLYSVETAEHLYRSSIRFTGVVKIETVRFPMSCLENREMIRRKYHYSLVSKVVRSNCEDFELMAVSRVDRNRRYFVSTTDTNLPGREKERINWFLRDGEEYEKHFIS